MNSLTKIANICTAIQESKNSFIILNNDKAYNLHIEIIQEKIEITICNKIPKIKFEFKFGQQDFIKENKIFSQFENLEKIKEFILGKIQKEEISIKEKKEKLSISFSENDKFIELKFTKIIENDNFTNMNMEEIIKIIKNLLENESEFLKETDICIIFIKLLDKKKK